MPSFLLALGIFLLTYVLISMRTLVGIKLERPAVALFGAALMVVAGVLGTDDVLGVFGPQGSLTQVILLLLGMMLLVGALELVGFFDLVARLLIGRARSPRQFLTLLMVTVALLSALVLNDTIVLLFTPVVIRSCRALGVNPVPYLVAEAVAANVGSVATEVGNPQIALIAIDSGIPFMEYTTFMAPLTAGCLALGIVILRWVYRKSLGTTLGGRATAPSTDPQHPRAPLAFLMAVTLAVVVAFFLSGSFGLNLPLVAFTGGAVATFAIPLFRVNTARQVFQRVDWSILLFFVGLFVLLRGVEVAGVMDSFVQGFNGLSGGQLTTVGWLTAIAAILSNLISNVPAVVLLNRVILPGTAMSGAAVPRHVWLTLAASSTLAGNATILGAAANVIVVQLASAEGVEVSPWEFVRGGLAVTLVTLVASAAYVQLLVYLGLA